MKGIARRLKNMTLSAAEITKFSILIILILLTIVSSLRRYSLITTGNRQTYVK